MPFNQWVIIQVAARQNVNSLTNLQDTLQTCHNSCRPDERSIKKVGANVHFRNRCDNTENELELDLELN